MNLGKLDPENEEFVNNYKKMGYATRTQLANDAIARLRWEKKKQFRDQWRKDAFSEIAKTKPDLAFDALDGEDFVNKSR